MARTARRKLDGRHLLFGVYLQTWTALYLLNFVIKMHYRCESNINRSKHVLACLLTWNYFEWIIIYKEIILPSKKWIFSTSFRNILKSEAHTATPTEITVQKNPHTLTKYGMKSLVKFACRHWKGRGKEEKSEGIGERRRGTPALRTLFCSSLWLLVSTNFWLGES